MTTRSIILAIARHRRSRKERQSACRHRAPQGASRPRLPSSGTLGFAFPSAETSLRSPGRRGQRFGSRADVFQFRRPRPLSRHRLRKLSRCQPSRSAPIRSTSRSGWHRRLVSINYATRPVIAGSPAALSRRFSVANGLTSYLRVTRRAAQPLPAIFDRKIHCGMPALPGASGTSC